MSYTELESGYQDLRQSTQQQQQQQQQQDAANLTGERVHQQRVGFYLGHDGNGDNDFGESNDGMDSDGSTASHPGKQVVVGICAMAKKAQSKPMKEILTRLQEFEFIKMVIFAEDVILKEPVENWPLCDCLISFHSKGFPLEKAIQYAQLRKPYVLNNLHMQYDIQDRRRVYAILQQEGIEIPRYAVLDRDSPDPKKHELIESEDHVEVNGVIFNKPFVEKPVSAEDHNIYIYYPTSAGGGSQRLFRKIGSRSSVYSPESRVRKTGSFIYEDFMPTDGTDVKVYTVGPDYAHAEARKSPALDGKVERDSEGKEIRYPVILNNAEKLISRKVCMAFKQTVCGFDLLRANGKSFVCDVNGFSFVKNSNKYYDDCSKILGNMILRELTPTLHIPWSVPFQLDDPPIVPTTFGKMMELRCVVAVIRHGDRTPKQKMKVEVRHPKFFEIFEKYDGYKHGHIKLKRPKQLQEILDIARFLLAEIQAKADAEITEKQSKLEQLKSVLEMYGHFSGINRKVQMKYQPKGRPRGSSSDDGNSKKQKSSQTSSDATVEPSLVLILKWGGELTPAGRIQAEELGRIFRCMYPGGQGRQDYSGTQGLGLLRLHSTFRHDLKIYASDEGRVQMTAAAFAKGLLALEGELTPILVQMVKSANTNGLLDNDCDSSKYQNMAKTRLHDLMRVDREFTEDDRVLINPGNSISINQAMNFVKNPVECCHYVHNLIKELIHVIDIKKDDPKTKDAILYHGETWDLMRCRWEKIEKDFSTKSKQFDISKIPDIYDCIKYDLQHNQHTLQYDQAEELYIFAKNLADIVIPQEYGLTMQEKLTIGQGICTPLLKKIKADLQRNIEEEVGDEMANRLNPIYSSGIASPGRHVRTRLYFTSESHVHSLLTVLRYGGLLNVLTDEQWRRAMEYISMVSELNYMSQIVIMLYEDPTKDPHSEERFHVELHFSPGVNCCVKKDLPPGPGFRPHSRNGSQRTVISAGSDDFNPERIDEEMDCEETPMTCQQLCGTCGVESKGHGKSKPIPIGSHHTVSGHEAMHLAKRLNEELASQQQINSKPSCTRPISPDGELRSRSYEQRHQKKKDTSDAAKAISASGNAFGPPIDDISGDCRDFHEIPNTRRSKVNPNDLQIRVTDKLSFFKIDTSTNELPLSDIDFSQNPSTPDVIRQPAALAGHKQRVLTMQRMQSGDEPDFIKKSLYLPKISPLATNERPLSCNCMGGGVLSNGQDGALYNFSSTHSHSKSLAALNINSTGLNYSLLQHSFSFDDEFQMSSSAPTLLMSAPFKFATEQSMPLQTADRFLHVEPATNSPTASTLKLCKAMNESHPELERHLRPHAYLQAAQSAPIIADSCTCPFRFPEHNQRPQHIAASHSNNFTKAFSPIAENTSASLSSINSDSCLASFSSPNNAMHLHQAHLTSEQLEVLEQSDAQQQQQPQLTIPSLVVTPIMNSQCVSPTSSISSLNNFNMVSINLPSTSNIAPNTTTITLTTTSTKTTKTTKTINQLNAQLTTNPNCILPLQSVQQIDHNHHQQQMQLLQPQHQNQQQQQPEQPQQQKTPKQNLKTSLSLSLSSSSSLSTQSLNTLNSHCIINASNAIASGSPTSECNAAASSSAAATTGRRQRHSIAGQMSYMKMLGFSGFNRKMATSTSSLFSTAVISGSSSAPNLRDMIPVSTSDCLEGFGDVPPIRPLETLHNALSLRKLDNFLEKMTVAPLFKTPTSSPPKNPSTPIDVPSTIPNELCWNCKRCNLNNPVTLENCKVCGEERKPTVPSAPTVPFVSDNKSLEPNNSKMSFHSKDNKTQASDWSKQSSIAMSSTDDEPSSPAISDLDTDAKLISDQMDLSKMLPTVTDDDLNSVVIFTPMNMDTLDVDNVFLGAGSSDKSACLTPVSFGMDLSLIANKGSMTLSIDDLDDDDEATLSAGTTPCMPTEEPRLETCYCCPTHAAQGEPPDCDVDEVDNADAAAPSADPNDDVVFMLPASTRIPDTNIISASPEHHANKKPTPLTLAAIAAKYPKRKATDPLSPQIQKQISMFEGSDYDSQHDAINLHASINIPQATSQLRQDLRLRKFENLTQSTSNSNFPFESNTLKRAPNQIEFPDCTHTQSCLNLKTTSIVASTPASATGSPKHKIAPYKPATMQAASSTAAISDPRPGALVCQEKFIEPPRRITRNYADKTQSMDADFLCNEFLLVPIMTPLPQTSPTTSSASASPTARSASRFVATKVIDDLSMPE